MLTLFDVAPGVVSSESSKAVRGAIEREDKQVCRFNSRNTVSRFETITGWLKSGFSLRTLELS